MNNGPLPKIVYEQLAMYRYRIRKFIRFSEEAARSKGLTPQCHQLMLSIMGFPERDYATPTELAEKLQIKPHACVELIKRSEELGLVSRFPNEQDRRSTYICLTEAGMRILRSFRKSTQRN